jgi:hypothetical protein
MSVGRIMGAAMLACSLLSSGCLINSHSRTEYSGEYVSPTAFSRVEVGESKRDFVLAALGEPTCKSTLDDGAELWKWKYKRTHCGNGSVFLLIDASDHTEKEGAAFVMFREGVVAKKWQD